jgi:hypothetical protein
MRGPVTTRNPLPDPIPSDAPPVFFGDARDEEFANMLAYVIVELRREWRADIRRLERRLLKQGRPP